MSTTPNQPPGPRPSSVSLGQDDPANTRATPSPPTKDRDTTEEESPTTLLGHVKAFHANQNHRQDVQDTYDPDESEDVGPVRKKPTFTARRGTKRKLALPGPENKSNHTLQLTLRSPRIQRTPATKHINKLFEQLPHLSLSPHPLRYTPVQYEAPPHVRDMLYYRRPSRRFHLSRDPYLASIKHGGNTARGWVIEVADASNQVKPIQPFFIRGERGNPDILFLQDVHPDEVVRLVEIFCDILARLPFDLEALQDGEWSLLEARKKHSYIMFAEQTALFIRWRSMDFYKNHVKLQLLDQGGPAERVVAHWTSTATITRHGDPLEHSFSLRTDCVPPAHTTSDQAASHPMFQFPIPAQAWKDGVRPQTRSQRICAQLLYTSLATIVGRIGSPSDLEKYLGVHISHAIRRYRSAPLHGQWDFLSQVLSWGPSIPLQDPVLARAYGHGYGPLDSRRILLKALPREKTIKRNLSTALTSHLLYDHENFGKTFHRNNIFGVRIRKFSRLLCAYIHECGLIALARGETALDVLLAVYEGADEVELEMVTASSVKAKYCSCSVEQASVVNHFCMGCEVLELCINMRTDEEGRKLCLECFSISKSLPDAMTIGIGQLVRMRVGSTLDNERAMARHLWQPQTSKADLATALQEYIKSDDTWHDDYTGDDLSPYPAVGRSRKGYAIPHPYSLSIEKPMPLFIDQHGNAHLHAVGNCLLTRLCLNHLPGDKLKAIMPWLKALLLEPDDLELHIVFDIFADNEYVIRRLWVPFKQLDRVLKPCTPEQFVAQFVPMAKSGKWNGQGPAGRPQLRVFSRAGMRAFRQPLSRPGKKSRKQFEMWTPSEISEIKNVIWNQTEANHIQYNKLQLKMPRGEDDLPFLFAWRHYHPKADWNWLFREMRARLWTLDEDCDEEHETAETPRSLLVEYVVQWFETAGKCPTFGFVMTFIAGHAEVYSIGRGLYSLDDTGNQSGFIQAGAQMLTGCIVANVTNMATQYSYSRRTIVFESWLSNAMRWKYPMNDQLMDMLRAAVMKIKDASDWWDAIDRNANNYRKVDLADAYWNRPRGAVLVEVADAMDEGTDEAIDDEVDDAMDEEIAYYEQHTAIDEDLEKEMNDEIADDEIADDEIADDEKRTAAEGESTVGGSLGDLGLDMNDNDVTREELRPPRYTTPRPPIFSPLTPAKQLASTETEQTSAATGSRTQDTATDKASSPSSPEGREQVSQEQQARLAAHESREAELQRQQAELARGQSELRDQQAEMARREKELAEQKAEMARRENELAEQQAEMARRRSQYMQQLRSERHRNESAFSSQMAALKELATTLNKNREHRDRELEEQLTDLDNKYWSDLQTKKPEEHKELINDLMQKFDAMNSRLAAGRQESGIPMVSPNSKRRLPSMNLDELWSIAKVATVDATSSTIADMFYGDSILSSLVQDAEYAPGVVYVTSQDFYDLFSWNCEKREMMDRLMLAISLIEKFGWKRCQTEALPVAANNFSWSSTKDILLHLVADPPADTVMQPRLVLNFLTSTHIITASIEPDLVSDLGSRVGKVKVYNSWEGGTKSDGSRGGISSAAKELPLAVARLYALHPKAQHWAQSSWDYVDVWPEITIQDTAHDCGAFSAYNARCLVQRIRPRVVSPAEMSSLGPGNLGLVLRADHLRILYEAAKEAEENGMDIV